MDVMSRSRWSNVNVQQRGIVMLMKRILIDFIKCILIIHVALHEYLIEWYSDIGVSQVKNVPAKFPL